MAADVWKESWKALIFFFLHRNRIFLCLLMSLIIVFLWLSNIVTFPLPMDLKKKCQTQKLRQSGGKISFRKGIFKKKKIKKENKIKKFFFLFPSPSPPFPTPSPSFASPFLDLPRSNILSYNVSFFIFNSAIKPEFYNSAMNNLPRVLRFKIQ